MNDEDLEREAREAFDGAKRALIYDYMYMGTEVGRDNLEYMGFKHIETRFVRKRYSNNGKPLKQVLHIMSK